MWWRPLPPPAGEAQLHGADASPLVKLFSRQPSLGTCVFVCVCHFSFFLLSSSPCVVAGACDVRVGVEGLVGGAYPWSITSNTRGKGRRGTAPPPPGLHMAATPSPGYWFLTSYFLLYFTRVCVRRQRESRIFICTRSLVVGVLCTPGVVVDVLYTWCSDGCNVHLMC